MSTNKPTAIILVRNKKNGERAALKATYEWLPTHSLGGGYWYKWIKPSARQVWTWCKCTGTGIHHADGGEIVALEVEAVISTTEGFFYLKRPWKETVVVVMTPTGEIFFRGEAANASLSHAGDIDRDDDGLLPGEEGYGWFGQQNYYIEGGKRVDLEY